MTYCQDGLRADFATETQEYTHADIYGHYGLHNGNVNGRPYFKKGAFGLWWDGIDRWRIGHESEIGQPIGFAYYDKDVFCPHQLSEWDWKMHDGDTWFMANNKLSITCKCFLLKQNSLNFISKYNLSWH